MMQIIGRQDPTTGMPWQPLEKTLLHLSIAANCPSSGCLPLYEQALIGIIVGLV